jgi:enterochelin esterase-like enzyme
MRTIVCLLLLSSFAFSEPKKAAPFKWVNKSKQALAAGVVQATFRSESMGLDVGYSIYLPPGYEEAKDVRYPVVYHLHGGRPGSELKAVSLAGFVDAAIKAGAIKPTIYVFPNGGPMSWYNYPQIENGLGEDVFVKELIPHIDKTYRSVGKREGRGIEGFSQGGRGTTRIMFKYPELFCSAAPGGSGYGPEKTIQENDGAESESVRFAKGYNTWDLAKAYAACEQKPEMGILLWVGTKGFNYEFNLKFSEYLDELKIPHRKLIAVGATHSAKMIYESDGDALMGFHQRNFGRDKD